MSCTRRLRNPQILADLRRRYQSGNIRALKQHPGSEIDFLTQQFHRFRDLIPPRKMSCFIEFRIVRDVCLRYNPKVRSIVHHGNYIVQLSTLHQRHTDGRKNIHSFCRRGNSPKRRLCSR